MLLQSNTYRRRDQDRRYFPDWIRRPLRAGEAQEADHNSYLAGGYAEEFGYLAPAESARGVPLPAGELPDDYRLIQWAGVHSGYPLRPYPISVDREKTARPRASSEASGGMSHHDAGAVRDRGNFIRVTERPYEQERRQLEHRAAAAVMRFVAAGVALRWKFSSLRRGR